MVLPPFFLPPSPSLLMELSIRGAAFLLIAKSNFKSDIISLPSMEFSYKLTAAQLLRVAARGSSAWATPAASAPFRVTPFARAERDLPYIALGSFRIRCPHSEGEGGYGKVDKGRLREFYCINQILLRTRGEGVKKSENHADIISGSSRRARALSRILS